MDQLTAALYKSFQPQGVRNFDVPQISPCGRLNVAGLSSRPNPSQVSLQIRRRVVRTVRRVRPVLLEIRIISLSATTMGLTCGKIEDSIGLFRTTLTGRSRDRLYLIPSPTNVEKTHMAIMRAARGLQPAPLRPLQASCTTIGE